MPMKGVHVETLLNPRLVHVRHQLERAADSSLTSCSAASFLLRERPPHSDCREWMDDVGVCNLCCRRAFDD
jgi:hypothetical protein